MQKLAEQPKYRLLYHELRSRLLNMEPGSNFYSMRDLMHNFSVSQSTVSKAVEALCDDGFLSRNVGSGTFVTEEVLKYRSDAPPVICLAIPQWLGYDLMVVENIFIELQEKFKFVADVIHFPWREGVIRRLPPKKIDGLIVLPASEKMTSEHISTLNGLHVPYVIFGQQLDKVPVNTVYGDEEYAAFIVTDHLIKLGHKKLALLVTEPRADNIEERVRGFERYCKLQHIQYEIIDANAKSGDDTLDLAYEQTRQILRKGKPDFTGLFVICESNCPPVYKAFHEAGVKIPDDVSIVSIGNINRSNYLFPGLTTVDLAYERRLSVTLEILKKLMTSEEEIPPEKQCVDMDLVIRESTARRGY